MVGKNEALKFWTTLLCVFVLTVDSVGQEAAEERLPAFEEAAETVEEPATPSEPTIDLGASDPPELENQSEGLPEPDTDTPAAESEPASSDAAETEDSDLEAEAPEESEPAASEWSGLMERAPAFLALTHHAAVHLPIALWLFGAFFVVVGVVVPRLRNQIPLACLIGGAVTSVAAAASGWWYADYEWGEPWDWSTGLRDIDWAEQLTQHRWIGVALVIASCILSVLAVISVNRTGWKLAVFWRLGLIALAAAVAWEGHIGGELIHGEGFLEEAYQEWMAPEGD